MLAELARREKEANIKPDPDVDIYMKVRPTITLIQYATFISPVFFMVLTYCVHICLLNSSGCSHGGPRGKCGNRLYAKGNHTEYL